MSRDMCVTRARPSAGLSLLVAPVAVVGVDGVGGEDFAGVQGADADGSSELGSGSGGSHGELLGHDLHHSDAILRHVPDCRLCPDPDTYGST